MYLASRHSVRSLAAIAIAVALVGAGGALLAFREASSQGALLAAGAPCDVPLPILNRVHRGFYKGRSGDLIAIERPPNQYKTRHSSPYPYTQNIPLFLYGPGYIKPATTIDRPVTLASVAPTYRRLLKFSGFRNRDGAPLNDALLPDAVRNGKPKVIVTIVWDGGGKNMLNRWPNAWPNLKDLMVRGTVYSNATVGSSPSITPSVHATLGTGNFPRRHGVSDITIRLGGDIKGVWAGENPNDLLSTTFADAWDKARNNRSKVAAIARDQWHMNMLGHGSQLKGGDRDIAVMDMKKPLVFRTIEKYFRMPDYIRVARDRLRRDVERVDRRDGKADGKWLGHAISATDPKVRNSPAWAPQVTTNIKRILERENFGRDNVADLLYVNYKATDLAHHAWNLVEPEVRDDLRSQDVELPRLIRTLDRKVGENNYVLVLTADHGVTPYPSVSGGWSINSRTARQDMNKRFDKVNPGKQLVFKDRGYQYYVRRGELKANGIGLRDLIRYLRNYTLEENARGRVPARYEARRNEKIYRTVVSPNGLRRALKCAREKEPDTPVAQRRTRSALRKLQARLKKRGFPTT